MPTTFFRTATWSLLIVVIVVLGMTAAGAVAHDLKHAAHHTAGMHSTGICAWMCAAAGAVMTPVVQTTIVALVESAPPFSLSLLRPFDSVRQLPARAPPTLLT